MPNQAPDASNELQIDAASREVLIGGRPLRAGLSPKEFELIAALYERAGRTVPRDELGEVIWGSTDSGEGKAVPKYDDHMLHALVHRVRGKLKKAGLDLNLYLEAIAGVGYRFNTNPVAGAGDDGGGGDGPSGLDNVPGGAWGIMAAVGAVLLVLAVVAIILRSSDDDGDQNEVVADVSPTPTAAVPVVGSEMIEPEPGSVLAGPDVTFRWSPGNGMIKHDLWVGRGPGADDFYNAEDQFFTEAQVTGLPTDGGPVYVFLVSSDGTETGTFTHKLEYTAATEPGGGISVYIDGKAAWVDSGIDIVAGDNVRLSACGQVAINSTGLPRVTPAGDPECGVVVDIGAFPLPAPPCWALVGRIGDGEAFMVGESLELDAQTSGRLFLAVNDDSYVDNADGFRATVWID